MSWRSPETRWRASRWCRNGKPRGCSTSTWTRPCRSGATRDAVLGPSRRVGANGRRILGARPLPPGADSPEGPRLAQDQSAMAVPGTTASVEAIKIVNAHTFTEARGGRSADGRAFNSARAHSIGSAAATRHAVSQSLSVVDARSRTTTWCARRTMAGTTPGSGCPRWRAESRARCGLPPSGVDRPREGLGHDSVPRRPRWRRRRHVGERRAATVSRARRRPPGCTPSGGPRCAVGRIAPWSPADTFTAPSPSSFLDRRSSSAGASAHRVRGRDRR